MEEKMCLKRSKSGNVQYEGILELSLLHRSEVWGINVHERKQIEAVEMNCLRNIHGLRRIDRVRNEEIRQCRKKLVRVSEWIRIFLDGLVRLKEWRMIDWQGKCMNRKARTSM